MIRIEECADPVVTCCGCYKTQYRDPVTLEVTGQTLPRVMRGVVNMVLDGPRHSKPVRIPLCLYCRAEMVKQLYKSI